MDDLISRQAAIDALVKAIREDPYYDSDGVGLSVCDVRVILNELPSAQLEPKTGRWLTHGDFLDRLICSECRVQFSMWHWEGKQNDNLLVKGFKHCPNCGVKMKGEEE